MSEGVAKPGMRVGRYRLQERLGRGSMGEVWQAHDDRLKRSVAIKLLDPVQHDPTELERFLQEARALGRVSHPNVVTIHDVGDWSVKGGQQPYIVMELLSGRTLAAELAERGRLSAAEVRAAGIAIASGLRAVHAAGVVHRDLSPANLMRTAGGRLKLVDFGVADVGQQGRLTRPGILLGSVSYAAPERVRGERSDARCDLYSLGCVLYELLCGRPPFEGDLVAVAFAHVFNDVVPPGAACPDLPDDLEAVVLALLAKDPAARPSSAARVLDALRDGVTLPANPVADSPQGLSSPPARRSRGKLLSRRVTTLVAAFVVVGLVIGLASSFTPDVQQPAKAAPVSPTPTESQEPGRTPKPRPSTQSKIQAEQQGTERSQRTGGTPSPTRVEPRPSSTPVSVPTPTVTVTTVVTESPSPSPTGKQKKPKKPKKDK